MVYDLVVIGAGYTGLGVALAAVEKGLSVAVIEQGEVGSGASANSHRIVHGGFRYLQKFNFKRVRESALAQAEVFKRYGDFVRLLPCYTPLAQFGLKSRWPVRCALLLFRLLLIGIPHPRVPVGRIVRPKDLPIEWGSKAPFGALLWYDLRVNDYDGLIAAVVEEIKQQGGTVLDYSRVTEVVKEPNGIAQIWVTGEMHDSATSISARSVANCVGAWHSVTTGGESSPESSDGNEAHPFSDVVWIKAFNIGLRRELVPEAAFAFSCNDADGALYFLVPRSSGSAIGTMYSEDEVGLEEMSVSSDEVAEVLRSVGRSFPELKLSFSDVRDIEVGLLPARMNKKSNKYELLENDQIATAVNFVDVIAVKFTTFLRLGRQVVASLYGKQDTDLVAP